MHSTQHNLTSKNYHHYPCSASHYVRDNQLHHEVQHALYHRCTQEVPTAQEHAEAQHQVPQTASHSRMQQYLLASLPTVVGSWISYARPNNRLP